MKWARKISRFDKKMLLPAIQKEVSPGSTGF
jgi:hypothetical protein